MSVRPGYFEEWADEDFGRALWRARWRAFFRRIATRLLRNDPTAGRPPSFEEVRAFLGPESPTNLGRREVEVRRIVASVGRSQDFDRDFLPTKNSLRPRWKCAARAWHRGEALPPVELYKVGDDYFVLDGNHRVSVARYMGAETIDAEVKEFSIPPCVPLDGRGDQGQYRDVRAPSPGTDGSRTPGPAKEEGAVAHAAKV